MTGDGKSHCKKEAKKIKLGWGKHWYMHIIKQQMYCNSNMF